MSASLAARASSSRAVAWPRVVPGLARACVSAAVVLEPALACNTQRPEAPFALQGRLVGDVQVIGSHDDLALVQVGYVADRETGVDERLRTRATTTWRERASAGACGR